jgi:hypothetical protein
MLRLPQRFDLPPLCASCERAGTAYRVGLVDAKPPNGPTIFWDERHWKHVHMSVPARMHYRCSHGHTWSDERLAPCAIDACEWNDK